MSTVNGLLDEALHSVCNRAKDKDGPQKYRVSVLTSSPISPAAKTIWAMLPTLKNADVSVYAVFADLRLRRGGASALDEYAKCMGDGAVTQFVRTLKLPNPKTCYEQIAISEGGVWIGGPMKPGLGAAIASGQFVDFHEQGRGFEHAEFARRTFAGAFRFGRPVNFRKLAVGSAPMVAAPARQYFKWPTSVAANS